MRTSRSSALDKIVWIGGPPDSGKTSVASALGERFSVPVYHFDQHEAAHFERADPVHHPHLFEAHPDRMGTEQRWLGSRPDEMARTTIDSWSDRLDLAVEDLLLIARSGTVLAEGPGFFPWLIADLLSDHRRAVWLVPTEAFARESVRRRQKLAGVPVSDRLRARENLILRDRLMALRIKQECSARGQVCIEVDGTQDLAAVTEMVAVQLGPFLDRPPTQD